MTRLPVVFALCGLCLLASGCPRTQHPDDHPVVAYPPADAYDTPPDFNGEWKGSVERKRGQLHLGKLRAGEYFGNFSADDGSLDIALHLEQSSAASSTGAQVPSNRLLFTWQDGTGKRGHGWFKIDETGDALNGSSGLGELVDGQIWLFTR